jgi:RNA polymerase sigma-70 factor, ECF subfamily
MTDSEVAGFFGYWDFFRISCFGFRVSIHRVHRMSHDPQPDRRPAATSTSRSLLRRLREDEPAAWERLTALYAPLVYHWCRRMGLPEQDMPDVFQQVFQSVAQHIEGFQKDRPRDTFRGWLRVITRNKVRDHFRRTARQPQAAGGTDAQIYFSQVTDPFADDADSADLDAALDGAGAAEAASFGTEAGSFRHVEEYRQLLHGAMQLIREHVHPQTWQAFWKVVVEGKTPDEAGDELGMRPGAVRVAKSRVLSRLRAELGELFG